MDPDHARDTMITVVGPSDFDDLLPLVRAYCDFYEASPTDASLLTLFAALSGDRSREGVQLIARDANRQAKGFATVYWTWSTVRALRIGVMNDLFVAPEARGTGLAERLIQACLDECREHGAALLSWQTAPDNRRAQTVYERVGATREQWVDYTLAVPPA